MTRSVTEFEANKPFWQREDPHRASGTEGAALSFGMKPD
jgi:hypothetical protein